jgi:hypothetical protein
MKITHELCIDHDSTVEGATHAKRDELLAALGHGPGFKLAADTPNDTVHGRVSIMFCDTRTLGEDWVNPATGDIWTKARLQSEGREVPPEESGCVLADEKSIAAYFEGQGHKLMKVDGNKAYGNTIINVQVTEADEQASSARKTTLKRPASFPTEKAIRDRLDNFASTAKSSAVLADDVASERSLP